MLISLPVMFGAWWDDTWAMSSPSCLQHCYLTHWGRDENGRHFADAIFKCIFLNENIWIPIKISLKFVPKGLINNIPALVQIMAWRRPGDKPLSEPMIVRLPTHICITRPRWVKSYTLYRLNSLYSLWQGAWSLYNCPVLAVLPKESPGMDAQSLQKRLCIVRDMAVKSTVCAIINFFPNPQNRQPIPHTDTWEQDIIWGVCLSQGWF